MPKTSDVGDDVANVGTTFFGFPNLAAPSPVAQPTLGTAPIVSSTPRPGQGVALTPSGVLPVSASATGLRMLSADPKSPAVGEFWYRTDTNQFCSKVSAGVKRVLFA